MQESVIEVRDLVIGYEKKVVMQNLNFSVSRGEVFCIMGGSGCGKSTLMKHMIGLFRPMAGDVRLFGQSIVTADEEEKRKLMQRFGVTYQGGALFGSMTVAENVMLPLAEYTDLTESEQREVAEAKLKQVDLGGYGDYMPAELSGGMRKRAGMARALALNPELLFCDEPSAGLDPITSAGLDRLILRMREESGVTIVVVTHDLDSAFTIGEHVIMLDKEAKTIVAEGTPAELRDQSANAWVREFLSRDGLKH